MLITFCKILPCHSGDTCITTPYTQHMQDYREEYVNYLST